MLGKTVFKTKEFQKFENEEYKSDEDIHHSGSDEGNNSVHDIMDTRFREVTAHLIPHEPHTMTEVYIH